VWRSSSDRFYEDFLLGGKEVELRNFSLINAEFTVSNPYSECLGEVTKEERISTNSHYSIENES
jgi:hypothetical protein